jgi:hypothetical protein
VIAPSPARAIIATAATPAGIVRAGKPELAVSAAGVFDPCWTGSKPLRRESPEPSLSRGLPTLASWASP